jgi:hypothetical protein
MGWGKDFLYVPFVGAPCMKPGPDHALDTCAFQHHADVFTRFSLQLATRHQDLLSCLLKAQCLVQSSEKDT